MEEVERERAREREKLIKAGVDVSDLGDEEEPDFLRVGPLLEKLERQNKKDKESELNLREAETDSDSEPEDEEALNKQVDMFEKKFDQYEKLLDKFAKAGSSFC